jgi:murein DD-endopeptidase MepM/ murein hydrolase activator NlpD
MSKTPRCRKTKHLLSLAALLLLGSFALSAVTTVYAFGPRDRKGASRAAKKKTLKGKLSKVRSDIKSTRSRLRAAKRSEVTIAAELTEIKARLNQTRTRLSEAKARLVRTRREQAKVAAALKKSQDRLRARELNLASRMAANYRQGPVRYASVVLGSRSMGEFVTRTHFVRTIVRYDAQLIAQIKADRVEVLRWKQQVDDKAKQVTALNQELAERQAEETQDTLRQRAVLAEAKARRAELEDDLNSLEDDSARIAATLRRLEVTPGGKARRLVSFNGQFVRPVPGGIVSSFGMRYHPILHRSRLHAGVDLSGSTGTTIVAAASGVVVFSGTMGGYGNVVVVDHGGGISTLYAHCSARLVGEGQSVSQGQAIARVGATGLATGPHLHFEVRKNGSPVNPVGAL